MWIFWGTRLGEVEDKSASGGEFWKRLKRALVRVKKSTSERKRKFSRIDSFSFQISDHLASGRTESDIGEEVSMSLGPSDDKLSTIEYTH